LEAKTLRNKGASILTAAVNTVRHLGQTDFLRALKNKNKSAGATIVEALVQIILTPLSTIFTTLHHAVLLS